MNRKQRKVIGVLWWFAAVFAGFSWYRQGIGTDLIDLVFGLFLAMAVGFGIVYLFKPQLVPDGRE